MSDSMRSIRARERINGPTATNEVCPEFDGTGLVPGLYGQMCECQERSPMTMNSEAKRNSESVFNQIEDVLLDAWDAGFAHGYGDGTQPGRGEYSSGEQVARINRSVVKRLWQRAESPEVVEAVRDRIKSIANDPHIKDRYQMYAEMILEATLTELIGPKPKETSHE